jgi:hypothetical protein
MGTVCEPSADPATFRHDGSTASPLLAAVLAHSESHPSRRRPGAQDSPGSLLAKVCPGWFHHRGRGIVSELISPYSVTHIPVQHDTHLARPPGRRTHANAGHTATAECCRPRPASRPAHPFMLFPSMHLYNRQSATAGRATPSTWVITSDVDSSTGAQLGGCSARVGDLARYGSYR